MLFREYKHESAFCYSYPIWDMLRCLLFVSIVANHYLDGALQVFFGSSLSALVNNTPF